MSLPSPPVTMSLPPRPKMLSSPSPPRRMSSPMPPKMRSAPSPPSMTSVVIVGTPASVLKRSSPSRMSTSRHSVVPTLSDTAGEVRVRLTRTPRSGRGRTPPGRPAVHFQRVQAELAVDAVAAIVGGEEPDLGPPDEPVVAAPPSTMSSPTPASMVSLPSPPRMVSLPQPPLEVVVAVTTIDVHGLVERGGKLDTRMRSSSPPPASTRIDVNVLRAKVPTASSRCGPRCSGRWATTAAGRLRRRRCRRRRAAGWRPRMP